MEATGPRPSRRPELVLGILAVMLAVAGAVIPFIGIGATSATSTGAHAADAHAAMNRALTSTMDASTVHATFTATITAQGKTVHLSGTSRTDREDESGAANVSVQAPGHHLTVSLVLDGGVVYMQIPQVAQNAPGKSWVSFPVPANGSPGTGASGLSPGVLGQMANLGTFLQVLRQSGATVETLGASTLGGAPVDGYRVTMDGAAVEAAIAKSGMPQAVQQALAALTVDALDFTVYTGNGLLRGVNVDTTASVGGLDLSMKATLRLTDYGQPVTVQPPPATSTVTFGQFEKSANSSLTGPTGLTGLRGMAGLGGFTAFLPAA